MNRAETAQRYNEQWFHGAPFGDPAADPEYEQLARRFLCGDVLPRGTLTDAQKSLVILAGLTAGNLFPALRRYTRAALNVGATPVEIKETVYQCAPYVGLERARCALEEINAAFKEAGVPLPTPPQGTSPRKTASKRASTCSAASSAANASTPCAPPPPLRRSTCRTSSPPTVSATSTPAARST